MRAAPQAVSASLLIGGLLLPWNIHVGVGIVKTPQWATVMLVATTLAALAGLTIRKARLALAAPHVLLVIGFTAVSIAESLRHIGDGTVAPGVGPGAWLGLAGALLVIGPYQNRTSTSALRALGLASVSLAGMAALLNSYLRVRFVVSGLGGPAVMPNAMTTLAALVYAAVSLSPVVIAARWLLSPDDARHVCAALLGWSAMLAATLVWLLPVGRDLDAFHGIAQNTATAGVGYEGYLAWAAAAALVGLPAVLDGPAPTGSSPMSGIIRPGLMLIGVWCAGMALLRIVDVILIAVLGLPTPPYNATTLMAFDVATGVVAIWGFLNGFSARRLGSFAVVSAGVLTTLTTCRVVVGNLLVPRSDPLTRSINDVFGNRLSQQVTSTFDVTLMIFATVLLVAAMAYAVRRPAGHPPGSVTTPDAAGPPPRIARLSAPRIARPEPAPE